jgi:hypothetical protein
VTAVATDAGASASASASEPAPVEAQAGWVERRAPQRDTDRSLTSATHHWLHTVPSGVHPKRLCRMHPRIANRIALAWADVDQTEKLFEELLQDKRGGRRGFPPIILNELRRLRDLHRNRSGVAFYRVRRR